MNNEEKELNAKPDERQDRIKKLELIKQLGVIPYAAKFNRTHSIKEARELEVSNPVTVAGRIVLLRDMGKVTFLQLLDASGRMQAIFKIDELGQDTYKSFLKIINVGDFIGIEGEIFVTQKGEISVLVKKYTFLSKALQALPEKFHGLKDVETKYRKRYLDLISNEESRKVFQFRSDFIKAIREFYWSEQFNEVETPTFLHQATGATATPYKTHNNALDIDLYLRISHELPLKELIVGGMEKIFELGKAYRNEGIDPSHLPEHTHLEHYCAYWDFEDNIKFTERMFEYIFDTLKLDKKIEVENRDGEKKLVDFSTPWKRVDFIEMLKNDTGIEIMKYTDSKELLAELKNKSIEFDEMDSMSLSGLVDNLYKKISRPKMVGPVILFNYPKYLQPLARVNDADQNIVDQFQVVVNGWEVIKAYSELVDPIDQKERFDAQLDSKNNKESEYMEGDDEFIDALEHGAPPISGWGMGVDRMVAILTNQNNLRDVVLFPLLRPKNNQ